MEIIRRFGQPIIYGTPTVLIVDPVFERAINLDSSPRWRNASSIGMDETVEYFATMAQPSARAVPDQAQSPVLAELLAEIDAWELEQADRLLSMLEGNDMDRIFQLGLHEFLTDVQACNDLVSDAISESYNFY